MKIKIEYYPLTEEESGSPQEEAQSRILPNICTKGGVKSPFPVMLMELLNFVYDLNPFVDYYGTSLRSIISWQPDGKCFRVHNKGLFENYVQPRYFTGQTNYISFRRQLNLWGFKRIAGPKTGPNFGAYYHPQFTRDDKYSCRLMRRIKNSSKKTKSTAASTAASVSRSNNSKESCRYPRSQAERVVPPCMDSSVPSSSKNYSSQRSNFNLNFSSPHLISRRNPSHDIVTSMEKTCSYDQERDEEMTVMTDTWSKKSNSVIDGTQFQDSFHEKIMRSLLEDKYDESLIKEEEDVFQLPDCEPLQEEDVGVGSMEISLLHIY